jgi:lysophospholipase L1-like esterase
MKQENYNHSNLKRFWVGSMIAGGVLVLFAFLSGRMGLSEPGTFGSGKFLLVLFGFLLLLVGLLGRRFTNFYKGFALIMLNTILLFFFIELVSRVVIKLQEKLAKSPETDVLITNFDSQNWTDAFLDEYNKAYKQKYYPWVVWRNAPFKGNYININEEGIRRTTGADCGPGSYTVFTFGGSTMWGYGSPDWGTIAAYLQSDLAGVKHQPVCTINFGDLGYVSTQGLIELMKQLQKGNIPNLVLFYDGVNDVYSGYLNDQACVHFELNEIALRFEKGYIQPVNPMIQLMQNSSTFQLIQSWIDKLKPGSTTTNQAFMAYQTKSIDSDSLSASIAKCYLGNYKLVSALAREYGFEYAFFWQPVISTGNKPLTSEEQEFRSVMDPVIVDMYTATYRIVEHSALEEKNLYYIANVFDEQVEKIWIDWMHVTPAANQLIAQVMLQKLGYQPIGK